MSSIDNNSQRKFFVPMFNKKNSPIVWYIPGLYSADDPQEKALQLLQTIYPDAEEITNVSWENQSGGNIKLDSIVSSGILSPLDDSNPLIGLLKLAIDAVGSITDRWEKALNDVRPTAASLANRIANNLSRSQRQKLILIGHSLGGNIIIRTLAQLSRQKLSVNSAVLLGAAIGNMDNDILPATGATQKPVCSIINPEDTALKIFQTVTGSKALGTGCGLNFSKSKFIERNTSSYIGHSSAFYLSQWAEMNNVKRDLDANPLRFFEDVVKSLGIDKDI